MHRIARTIVAACAAIAIAGPVAAQTTPAPLKFSGVIYGNWQNHSDSATRAANGGRSLNKFDIERVYLNFAMPAGDRASIRATTDVFQKPGAGFYDGWTVRLKYAWLRYELKKSRSPDAWSATADVGLITTPIIAFEESYWPRWLAQTAPDRNGLFPSSDAGVGAQLTLPDRLGSLHGTLTNGSGYSGAETDRFKDDSLRLSVTPWARRTGMLSTLSVSPWIWRGKKGSKFAEGGVGQTGPITDGLDRNRWGVAVAVRDPRLTAGAEYARRIDASESGANTAASPDLIFDRRGDLADGYVIVRPGAWSDPTSRAPLGLVLRFDRVRAGVGNSANDSFLIGGLFYDITDGTAVSIDYQTQSPHAGSTTPASNVLYMHWMANF
jgi:hypothetical protein